MGWQHPNLCAAELESEVAGWLSAGEAADAEEDKLYGRDKTGEELPDWVSGARNRGTSGPTCEKPRFDGHFFDVAGLWQGSALSYFVASFCRDFQRF